MIKVIVFALVVAAAYTLYKFFTGTVTKAEDEFELFVDGVEAAVQTDATVAEKVVTDTVAEIKAKL